MVHDDATLDAALAEIRTRLNAIEGGLGDKVTKNELVAAIDASKNPSDINSVKEMVVIRRALSFPFRACHVKRKRKAVKEKLEPLKKAVKSDSAVISRALDKIESRIDALVLARFDEVDAIFPRPVRRHSRVMTAAGCRRVPGYDLDDF